MTDLARPERTARRVLGSLLVVMGGLPVALDLTPVSSPSVARAELIDGFTPPAFNVNTTGAIDIIGNALLTCGTSNNCQRALDGTTNGNNNSFSMQRHDLDDAELPAAISAQTTSSSSRAVLNMPAGSTVLYAGLYWSAQSNATARRDLKFLPPGATSYTTVRGTVDNVGSLYQAHADVTGLVAAGGNGDYWGGDISTFTGGGRYAAWSMAVVYENPSLPVRSLSVFEGFGRVTSSFRILDVPISGFLTPPFGPVNAEVGVVAYEGDRGISGDQVLIDTDPGAGTDFDNLTDSANPNTNFGNGSISDAGVLDLSGSPGAANNLSIDIDEFATTNLLANAQTETTVRFQTTGDWWYPGALTFAVDLFVPEFPQVTKTVVDLNGGDALPGDQLEYSVSFTNTGNDGAENAIVRDLIPDDTTFVPGSLQVNGVNQSDAANTGSTDFGDFDGTQIIGRLGAGANGTEGGNLPPGVSTEVAFRVTIDESARGTDIENSASLDYVAQTLQEPFTFTTNETITPVPPRARLRITKSGAPNPVVSGEQVTWTMVITNDGPNIATGVLLGDTMTNTTYASVNGATCPTAGVGDVTLADCEVDDIAVGASRTVTIVSDTDPSLTVGTQVVNTASVAANEEDDQQFNNSATGRVTASPESDLRIEKTDAVDPVAVGETINYTLTIFNDGPSDARDVRISDQPDGATTATAVAMVGATCDVGSRSCLLPLLEAGDSATMTVDALVRPFASGGVTNRAEVRSPNPDPDESDNVVLEPTDITQIADVGITKTTPSAIGGDLVAGDTVVYRIDVTNAGPSTATAVEVLDSLDPRLSFISAVSTVGACSGDPAIDCDLGDLASGGSATITITATLDADAAPGTANLANTATVSTDTPEATNLPNTSTVTNNIVNEADLRITKEVDRNPLVIGDPTPFQYTVTVTNDGPSVTSSVITMNDAVPAGLTPTAAAPGCLVAGQDVTCTSTAPLAVGASLQFTIDGTVTGPASPTVQNTADVVYADDPDTSNNTAVAETDLITDADVRIDKEWSDATVVAGANTTFTLEVVNDGPTAAAQVDVADLVPSGTIVSATGTGADCSASAGSSLDCDLGSMASGDSVTITVEVTIDPAASTGDLANSADVTVTGTDDRNPSNNSDTDLIEVTRLADLTVAKQASNTTPVAGETITYTVTVDNAGPSSAEATFVGDPLPPQLTLVEPLPAGCTAPGGVLTCDLGDLSPSDPAVSVVYTVLVDPAAPPGVDITNTASASSPTPDPTPPTIDEVITPSSEADLTVVKDAVDSSGQIITDAVPGGPLTYRITVSNAGPSDAYGVDLTDTVPVGFTATAATSTQGSCTTAALCTIGDLAVGGSAVITLEGTIDASFGDSTLTNETDALTAAATTLVNTGDDTDDATVDLAPEADLVVSKSANVPTIDAGGGQVTYVVSVSNAGPSDALDVDVTDTLPAGFVVDSVTPSQGTCSTDTTCELETIAAGDPAATITYVGFFPSTQPTGTVTNSATATSSTPLANTDDDTADVPVDVTAAADVTLNKSGPLSVVAGESRIEDPNNPGTFTGGAQYLLSVGNDGPSIATGVELTDVLDPAIIDIASVILAVTPTGACAPTNAGGVITCAIGDLPVGELVTLSITANIRSDAPAGTGVLVNDAQVATATNDPVPANNSDSVTTDITINSDIGVLKTDPVQFTAGEEADYTITVTNDGPSDAVNVTVTDPVPAGVTFGAITSVPAGCTALPCTIASLPIGEQVVITVPATVEDDATRTVVTNEVTVSSETPDLNSGNNTSEVNTGVINRADLEVVSKTGLPATAVAGEILSYTIDGRNNGPSTSRDAVITDVVPVGTTLVPGSLDAGCTTTGNDAGDTITCELGDLAPDATVSLTFDVVIDADATAPISNTATIASPTTAEPDGAPDNDSKTATNPVGGEADLGITKSATPTTAVPGESLEYLLTVTNAGPSTARDVAIADDVSGIFDGAITVVASNGVTCDDAVACPLFDLPVGSMTVTITGLASAANTASIPNTATVSSATPEPADATLPNTATISTPVAPSADLSILKVDDVATTVDPTGAIEYTITVANAGPSNAENVVIDDVMPVEVESPVISSEPTGCTAFPCTFPTLAVGDDIVVTVTGTISDRAVGSISNTATVASDTDDLNDQNDSATEVTDITPVADVGITKVLDTDPLVAGETARYTIVIDNNGPAAAADVELDEALPAGVSFVAISSPIGTCDSAPTGNVVNCQLGTLNDQASVTITVEVLVDAATTANLINTATVATSTDEPAGGNPNTASTDSPIIVAPDLRVSKALVPGDPNEPDLVAGEPFEYLITVTNDGPSVAGQTFTVIDQLPAQILPAAADVSVDNPNCTYEETGGALPRLITCNFTDDLIVGDSVSISVTGTIDPAVTSDVDDNTATVSTTDDDPNDSNDSGTATATLVTNADLVATKVFGDDTVIAGESTTFTMSVVNNGPSNALAVVLADTMPVGHTITGTTPDPVGAACVVSSGQDAVDCELAELAVGDTFSVEVTVLIGPDVAAGPWSNTATASSDTPDRNPSNNEGVDDIEITREADLSITKLADAASVLAGNTITYTITYRNDGPSSAETSVIGDQLPMGVTFVDPLPAGCTEAAGILECDLGLLAPMAPADPDLTFSYTVVVDPAVADATDIVNSATISSITPPPGGTPPPPSTAVVTVGTQADVELVSKTVTPDPVIAGTDVEYTIIVRNNGPSIARNTTIDDDLPAPLAPVEPLPAGCTVAGNDVSCNLGTLMVDEERTITFSATVAANTAVDGPSSVIVNDASVTSDEPDNDLTNQNGTATTNVDGEADISITKTATPDPAVPGQPIRYTITVANAGPSQATSVVVDDVAPAEIAVTAATSSDGSVCTTAVRCDIGELDAGETITITIDADVLASVTDDIDNTATVASVTPPTPGGPERTVTIITPVEPAADLAIAKALSPTAPVPGEAVEYTITVTNPGPSDSQNVVVVDTIDAAVTNLATTSAGCVIAGQDVTCTFGTLVPGTTTMVVTGDLDEAFTGDLVNTTSLTTDTPQGPNTSPDSATVTAPAEPDADVRLDKAASPDPVFAGEALTYTLTVSNDGPSTAVGVVVDDVVPAGFDVDAITSSQGDCTGVPCSIGTLIAGQSETVTIVGAVNADVLDLPVNTATVDADTPDSDTDNNTADADPDVDTSASVVTTKALTVPADGTVVPGQAVEWQIVVANNGPSDALDVVVDDAIPALVTDVVITSTPPGCTAFPCDLGTLETSASVTITIAGNVPSDTPAGDLVNNAATSSGTFDPDLTDNNPQTSNPIGPSADLTIVKSGPLGPITPGTEVTYDLLITNAGPSDADVVSIADSLPDAFDPATLTEISPLADCSFAGLDLNCVVPVLEAGDSIDVAVTGTVLEGFVGAAIENSATVGSFTPDPDPNNTSTVSNDTAPVADVGIAKTLTSAPPIPGESVSYEIVVTNAGPSSAQNVVITDVVDANVTNLATATPGCSFNGQTLTCNLGTLPIGSSVIAFTGDLDEAFLGDLSNTANVTTDTDQGADALPNTATSDDTAEADADLSLTKSADPDPVTAGQALTYVLSISNAGPSTAVDVVAADSLPAGFTVDSITSTQGGCTAVPCDLGSMLAGDTATVTIVGTVDADVVDLPANLASVASNTPDSQPDNNGDDVDPDVQTRAELSTTKIAEPATLVPGTTAAYTITVTNAGPSDALNTVVTDAVPAELTVVSITSSRGGCAAFPCTLGTVAAGTSETVTVNVAVPSDITVAEITNSATADSDTLDTDDTDDTGTTTNPVTPSADLVIDKVGPATPAIPGESVTYTVTVTNDGPSDAFALDINDTLDAAFDPATIVATSADAVCVVTDSDVACTQATLAVGDTTTVEITATVLASFTGVSIDNTATVVSATADPNGPNESSITTPVAPSADLTIVKLDDVVTTVDPSGVITYTITVTNAGPSDAQNVEVTDVIPADVTPTSISSTQGGCAGLPCTLGLVPANTTATITIVGDVSDRALDTITNTASVSSDTPDDVPGGETSTVVTDVTPFADLSIAKNLALPAAPDVVTAGLPARYELVVANAGPAIAAATVVDDVLPDGVSFVSASTPAGACLHDGSATGGQLTCDLGDLGDGSSVTILVNVVVAADQTTDLSNTATVGSPTVNDPIGADDSATLVTPVQVAADLQVTKSLVTPVATVTAGEPFEYGIQVVNNGPSTSVETIQVTDTLPAQVLASSVVVTPALAAGSGCTFDQGTLLVACEFPADLPADGSTIDITITGTIESSALTLDPNTAEVATIDDPAVDQVDDPTTNNSSTATADLATNADLLVTKTFLDDTTTAGDPAGTTFTITVENAGPSDALDVSVTDTLPAGMTVADVVPVLTGAGDVTCTPNGGAAMLPCTSTRIAAGETLTLTVTALIDSTQPAGTVQNTADASSSVTPDRNPSNTSTDSIDVVTEADLRIAKTADPSDSQNAGEDITYTIEVRNLGPSTAEGTLLGDQLPAGVTIDESSIVVTGAPQNCAAPGGLLTCDLGPLSPTSLTDPAITISYTVTIDPDVADGSQIENAAQITSPTPLPNPTDPPPSSSAVVDVTTLADLSVTKTADPVVPVAGESTTYSVVVTNDGPSVGRAVQIVDSVPAGLTVQPASLPDDCSITGGPAIGTTITCQLGDVPPVPDPAAVVTLTYDVDLDPSLIDGSTLTNTVTVSSPTADPDLTPASNQAAAPITVATIADLGIAKVASVDPAVPGEPLTYTLTLTNAGPSSARNVTIEDADIAVFPAGVTTTVTGAIGTCDDSVVSCTFAEVLPGDVTIEITGIVDARQLLPVGNTATITATDTGQDTTGGTGALPDTVTIETAVAPVADLAIVKTITTDPVVPGEPVAFQIEVTNPGPSSSVNVVVTDVFDAALTNIALTTPVVGCSITDQTLACTFGVFDPGTVTIDVTADLDEAFTGDLDNTASLTTDTDQGDDLSANGSTATTTVTPQADVRLDKTGTDVVAGENTTYTITATNDGPSTAVGVTVSDVLPAGLTLVSVSSSQGACTSLPCVLGTLADQQIETVTVVATLDASAVSLDANQAAVTASTADPDPDNNEADATPAVDTRSLLTTTKEQLSTPAVPGTPVEWTITVVNDGPSDALDVTVADVLPAEVTNAVLTPSQGDCVAADCQLGTIAAGQSATIAVIADLPANVPPGDLVNQATTSTSTPVDQGSVLVASTNEPIAPSADVQVVKTATPDVFVPGEPVEYVFSVTNNGPSDAQGLEFTDRLPLALDLSTVVIDDGTASCTRVDRDVTCTQATLADNGTITVTIDATITPDTVAAVSNAVTLTTTTDDPITDNDASDITNQVAPQTDIGIAKVFLTDPVVPGEVVDFLITVTNGGPSTAQGVVVTDTLGLDFTQVQSTTPGCVVTDNTVTCTLGPVDPGSVTIAVSGTLASAVVGDVSNTAEMTTSTTQIGDLPDTATAIEPAVPSADLQLTKTATPDPVTAGEDVTYLITVDNLGPSDAVGVVVADVLPAGLTVVSVTPSQGTCAALPCDLGTIVDEQSATVTVVATVDAAALALDANSASVDADTADPIDDNNTAEAEPTVATRADLIITKTLATPSAVPGAPLRWTITVDNPGPSDALAVTVADELPADATNPIVASSQGGCTTFLCELGTVPAGGQAVITIDADVPASTIEAEISNTAIVSSATPDGSTDDNSSTATNPIAPAADLQLAKVGPSGDVVAGTAVSWTLTITNAGPSDSRDVVVTDELPDALDPASIVVTAADATCVLTDLSLECTQAVVANGATSEVIIDAVLRSDFIGTDLDNTASVASLATTDLDDSNNTASASAVNAPLADVVISGTVTPNPVAAGSVVDVVFTVTNDGPSNAADTVVRIPIPASITLTGTPVLVGAPDGATVTVVDGIIVVDLGSLPPDTPIDITFSGTVSPDQPPSTLPISAAASTSTAQASTDNDASTVDMVIVSDIELSIAKTASAPTVDFGDSIDFTITVINDGSSTATGVQISDDLPTGVLGDSVRIDADPDAACSLNADRSSAACSDLTVPADGGTVVVTITAGAVGQGAFENVATVSCDCLDALPVESEPAPFEVIRQSDLGVTKVAAVSTVGDGTTATFTITAINNGPHPADGVQVLEQLPAGLSYSSHTTATGVFDPATNLWTIGELPVGVTVTLSLVALAGNPGVVTNAVSIQSVSDDLVATNNTATASITIEVLTVPTVGQDSTRSLPYGIGLIGLGVAMLWFSRRRGHDVMPA